MNSLIVHQLLRLCDTEILACGVCRRPELISPSSLGLPLRVHASSLVLLSVVGIPAGRQVAIARELLYAFPRAWSFQPQFSALFFYTAATRRPRKDTRVYTGPTTRGSCAACVADYWVNQSFLFIWASCSQSSRNLILFLNHFLFNYLLFSFGNFHLMLLHLHFQKRQIITRFFRITGKSIMYTLFS